MRITWIDDEGDPELIDCHSIVTAQEVIALAALQPDHMTLSGAVLDELASLPPVFVDRFDDILKRELTAEELKSAYIVVSREYPNRIYSC